MTTKPLKNAIIVIEGIDGCGKGTQAEALAAAFHGQVLKFPAYATPTGGVIRHVLTNYPELVKSMGSTKNAALVLQALQVTNKYETVPAIAELAARGPLVLDRYWHSAMAYGTSDGLDLSFLTTVHAELPLADICFLLDIDASTSFRRRPTREDAYEADRLRLVRAAEVYRHVWDHPPAGTPRDHYVVIDGKLSPGEITALMVAHVKRLCR